MAEFCLDCLNKYIMPENEQLTEEDVTTDTDLCEGCGEIKPCVISIKKLQKSGSYPKALARKMLVGIKATASAFTSEPSDLP